RILMPGDPLSIARHLAKKVRPPTHHVLAQQVLHTSPDARIREQIVNPRMAQVRSADGVTVAAGCQRLCQQGVEITADRRHLRLAENPNSLQITVAIERRYLLPRERPSVLLIGRMKAELALNFTQFVRSRDEIRSACRFHFP